MLRLSAAVLLCCGLAWPQDTLSARARQYLAEMIRLDTTNPPGNESRMARYIQSVLQAEGIRSEIAGESPERLNVVARLPGTGGGRPLLLMAHTDVVPADPQKWTVPPFAAEVRQGFLYGRGAQDDKSLLAVELAVFTQLKRQNQKLRRDVILMAEADEEADSTGVQWLIRNAWPQIDAEFALNEGGFSMDLSSGRRVFQIQTAEKIPTRALLRAHGTAGHGSLPRQDNPVVALARALARLADADQPVRMNATTRRYFTALADTDEFHWLEPLLPALGSPKTAMLAAAKIRRRDPELDAQLRTTISPTMLNAGSKVNVIPNSAEAQVDVRRLPDETRDEVIARMRRIVHDESVEIQPSAGQEMPATAPSSLDSALYKAMEEVFEEAAPGALVVPYMQRGATDGSFLRQKGMAVYGVPLFVREDRESRAHGNDERISWRSLDAGAKLLWSIVVKAAQ